MIPLGINGQASRLLTRMTLGRVTRIPVAPEYRSDYIWAGSEVVPDLAGYAAAVVTQPIPESDVSRSPIPMVHGVSSLDHIADGDVVAAHPTGYVRTLYRRDSPSNAIFVTDRCNSYCLMCSQPPRSVDDRDRIAEHLRLVDLMDPAPNDLAVTGGEPTLLKDDLIRLISHCKERLPSTGLHVLSNGRLFYYGSFASAVAEVGHPDLVFGVPLYSDVDFLHDHVVQSRGAFDETVIGLQNLGQYGVSVEIRVVLHQLTHERLPELAAFIYRNFPFAAHVALMGLEPIGLAVPNLRGLWIDPWEYGKALEQAVLYLDDRGMRVSLYNHQLCVVPAGLRRFCRKSISDWKAGYLPVCDSCALRSECGGFFASALERQCVSAHIEPFAAAGVAW
jgi:His-Xaa-Ser system radical SAM maturase HxsC